MINYTTANALKGLSRTTLEFTICNQAILCNEVIDETFGRDFSNSPLEKGDKGGCDAELEEETKKTTPSAPVIKGEFFHRFSSIPVFSETYRQRSAW
jgi:hypothetical protein